MIRKLVFVILIPLVLIVSLYFYMVYHAKSTARIVVNENLDDVVATVDGHDLTLGDLAFYILYEESKVEKMARIYNPDNTKDYWNTHTNGYFVEKQVKETVIKTAIHDYIFINLASAETIVMTSEQKALLETARSEFWEGLIEGQLEKLPLSYEDGNRIMKDIAIAQIYQQRLAEEMDTTYASLNWGGYDYEKVIMKEHKVKINDKVWDRVVMGDISLTHDRVNYINGLSDEEIEKLKNGK